ncbi:MAG: sialate O-acetylesterase [Opitutus sp.]|nr:sialate O-acetylesterase [Opitutus sp.]
MKPRAAPITLVLGLLGACGGLRADPRPAPLFSDHAVLQRGVTVPVWGTADAGEKITVTYRGASATAVADERGQWRVALPPMQPGPAADLAVQGKISFVARDVVIGDVWLLTGQSNMELALSRAADGADAAAAADLPWLRHLKVPHRVSDHAETVFTAAWVPSSPPTAPSFSAVGFFFARHLYRDDKVPVGLLNVSRGGTTIEAWMSPRAVQQAAYGPVIAQRWQEVVTAFPRLRARYEADRTAWERAKARAEAAGEKFTAAAPPAPPGPGRDEQLSGLFHGMMAAVLPFAVRGVVWYQGESNVGRPSEYADLLAAMIKDWRSGFEHPALPFFVVQLPNYQERKLTEAGWAGVRAAQAKVVRDDPRAHLAVTIDVGDSHDKHPRNKSEVGRRLALLARRHVFGEPIAADSPVVKLARRDGREARLDFETQGAGLVLRAVAAAALPPFEIAGADLAFVPATARLVGDTLIVGAASVREPCFVRYLQQEDPSPCLFTADGLPAAPFQVFVRQPAEKP